MERKINLLLLNVFLVVSIIATFIIVLVGDMITFWRENPGEDLVFWRLDQNIVNWNDDGPAKLVSAIVSCLAAAVFFRYGKKYGVIRQQKADKHLASQIYFSLVYLGIARLFETFFIISDSSLRGIVFSFGKYYILLDLLGVVMFVLVAAEVFLQTEIPATSKFSSFLHGIVVASVIIALSSLFLEYVPSNIETIIDWSVVGASIIIILIIGIILIVICTKILRLYQRFTEQESRGAILIIGLQLILFILAMFMLIALEIGKGDAAAYFLRAARGGLMLCIGFLYQLSFINPALKKKENK